MRLNTAGARILHSPRKDRDEVFLSLAAHEGDSPEQIIRKLDGFLKANPELHIVKQDLFGLVHHDKTGPATLLPRLPNTDWPILAEGITPPVHPHAGGTYLYGLIGPCLERLRLDGRVIGTCYQDDHADYCLIHGIGPGDASSSFEIQARRTFERMSLVLREAGMNFSHVMRTWFYLKDILDWYPEFNRVRDRFFAEQDVFQGVVPASTGVSGVNPAGTAVLASAMAVKPRSPHCVVRPLTSPLQCAALDYGSSFSRAVELRLPDKRCLYVSGTASISPEGQTLHPSDVTAQIMLTLDVVQAILESNGMTWNDVVRALAYFKDARQSHCFYSCLRRKNIPHFPHLISENTICRDNLLFELELDAQIPAPSPFSQA